MTSRMIRSAFGVTMILGLATGVPRAGIRRRTREPCRGRGRRDDRARLHRMNRHVHPSAPAESPPVWLYVPAPAARTALPAPGEPVTPSEPRRRAEPRAVERAIDLPALARRNPYLAFHRGWVHGYWTARIADSRLRPIAGPDGAEATSWNGPRPGPGWGWAGGSPPGSSARWSIPGDTSPMTTRSTAPAPGRLRAAAVRRLFPSDPCPEPAADRYAPPRCPHHLPIGARGLPRRGLHAGPPADRRGAQADAR